MVGASVGILRKLIRNPSPDRELLERFSRQRDEAAFGELMRRHGPLVLGVCRRVLKQTQDAEDAFQATFLLLAQKAGALGKRESVANWLHGVARRMAANAKVAAARRSCHERRATVSDAQEIRDDVTWK